MSENEEKGYRVVDKRRVWTEERIAQAVDRINDEGEGEDFKGPGTISDNGGVMELRDADGKLAAVMAPSLVDEIRKEAETQGRFVPEYMSPPQFCGAGLGGVVATENGLIGYGLMNPDGTLHAPPDRVVEEELAVGVCPCGLDVLKHRVTRSHFKLAGTDRQKAIETAEFYDHEAELDEKVEMIGPPDGGEPAPRNRRERKADAKAKKKLEAKLKKAQLTINVTDEPTRASESPLDMISLMAEIANTCNLCVAECEDHVKRVPGGDRHAADELQMAMQIAFMLGYLDAHGPKDAEGKLRIIEAAYAYRKQLRFRTQEGELVTPKETKLVEAAPSIIPATSLVHLR